MHLERLDLARDRLLAGQEARLHAPGDGAQAEIDAGGLDLLVGDRLVGLNAAGAHELAIDLIGQDAGGEPRRGRDARIRKERVATLLRYALLCHPRPFA